VPAFKGLITGVFIFVAGVIINELLLMFQGVGGMSYTSIPYIDVLLLVAALILVTGIAIMFGSCLRKPVAG
jgi:ABC-type nitrate/sulfonate/bicarbonate transport system permease component